MLVKLRRIKKMSAEIRAESLSASAGDPDATGNFSAVALVIQWSLTGFH